MEERSWSAAVSHLVSKPECGQHSALELLRLVVTTDS